MPKTHQLLHHPDSFEIVLSSVRSSLAARGRKDAADIMLHVPASTSHNANTSLTEQTDADAQFKVGMRYYKGEDVPKDYAKAAYWFCKSADQGHPDGQWHLSMLYFNGQGLPKDYKLAAEWCRKATENGSPAAQFYTAYKLLCGLQDNLKCGGRQDYTMAAQWCRKAAEQGHVEAPYNLGSLYYHGQGVPQDYKEAYFWQVIGDTGDDSVQRPPTRKKSIGENLSPKERTEVLGGVIKLAICVSVSGF